MSNARHPLVVIFLLHIALEIPLAIQGVWSPNALPFLELNNTTIVLLKLYSALSLSTCLISLLCYSLPDFLPGKRALAMGLCVYHSVASTVFFQAPRFIPHSLGPLAEQYKVTPEIVWGTLHGLIGLGMVAWWQVTVPLTSLARAASKGS
ncbi:hypothetical protein AGABI1DRAFT_115605 [Agaricus bisporus var. burnettii JB137-S8]|nr:hypothetical protein AGABI2DRAFT_224910 [Agaricus bisporus var. bisporus H97]XP_007332619.1 uncharacterized protein AGABI1DRAFT_115605 [Agaricus bisporus var. burnettii JB137-S8]EKM76713.1 hypothetical protein AGABI1DRAFT_115605 [Agaricus bisporus var. burnettii JB137-S8]EKV45086.1 hypothetical protein AGABI2DRAFT_224910 [Agaricus bisporus var. bisporus H97]